MGKRRHVLETLLSAYFWRALNTWSSLSPLKFLLVLEVKEVQNVRDLKKHLYFFNFDIVLKPFFAFFDSKHARSLQPHVVASGVA